MSEALRILQQTQELMVVQRRELAELFGIETKNQYVLEADGMPFGYAAEQGTGGLAFLARMFFGHFRTFEIHVLDDARQLFLRVLHPFRFFFQRLEVSNGAGLALGTIERRFSILTKRFDVNDPTGRLLLRVSSPIWRPWTFEFERDGHPVARVEKKWPGFATFTFTDADRFRVAFESPSLGLELRSLVLAAALFIDLQFFEHKAQ